MEKSELRYIIGDYCSQYEIDITDEQLDEAVEDIAEIYADQEEYNYRCGVYSVNINLILDSYFDDFEEG